MAWKCVWRLKCSFQNVFLQKCTQLACLLLCEFITLRVYDCVQIVIFPNTFQPFQVSVFWVFSEFSLSVHCVFSERSLSFSECVLSCLELHWPCDDVYVIWSEYCDLGIRSRENLKKWIICNQYAEVTKSDIGHWDSNQVLLCLQFSKSPTLCPGMSWMFNCF